MAESKIISSNTVGTIKTNGEVEVYTFYNGRTDIGVAKAIIAQDAGRKNGTKYKEGELLIRYNDKAYPKLAFVINERGELIAIGINADKYEIEEGTGELQYIED